MPPWGWDKEYGIMLRTYIIYTRALGIDQIKIRVLSRRMREESLREQVFRELQSAKSIYFGVTCHMICRSIFRS